MFLKEFMNYLDLAGEKYNQIGEKSVSMSFAGENLDEISCTITISEVNGNALVLISCYDFPSFKGNLAKGLLACNEANNDALVTRFYIDDDNDVVANYCIVYGEVFRPEHLCTEVQRMAGDVDDAAIFFARAM